MSTGHGTENGTGHTPTDRDEEIRRFVRERYAQSAVAGSSCCGPASSGSSCCGAQQAPDPALIACGLGYSEEDIEAAPPGANLGRGCGNPLALAFLRPAEVVLDLGCGGGFDCFLAARRVGEAGRVIGVDMTPEMISRARENAARAGLTNVEFRLGEIEHLPVADAAVDVIMSNCVINLSPDKAAVYREAFRVLKPGGRLAISDVVALRPLPETWVEHPDLYGGCIAGAISPQDVERLLQEAGFVNVTIRVDIGSRELIKEWRPGTGAEDYVASASIEAAKPNS